jgi:hypothetical protein
MDLKGQNLDQIEINPNGNDNDQFTFFLIFIYTWSDGILKSLFTMSLETVPEEDRDPDSETEENNLSAASKRE